MAKHDWQDYLERLNESVEKNGKFDSYPQISKFLGVPVSTVKDAVQRGVFDRDDFIDEKAHQDPLPAEKPVKTKISGNTAFVKYAGGEPLSEKELMTVAGLDPDEWAITDVDTTAWQIGRKGKRVQIDWNDGRATGFVNDSGKIHKEYLFRINLKLTRKNRIAVKAVLKPIELTIEMNEPPDWERVGAGEPGNVNRSVLFICDPHFGFTREMNGTLTPFHDRKFIGGLLALATAMKPDVIVFNGDALDLPDLSSFNSEPAILFNVQSAGIELAFVLEQFSQQTFRQIYLEGNHEERLNRAMKKNFAAAFNLKPAHDLRGAPLVSVPRFLGLDRIDTEYVDGYPDNFAEIGQVRFEHGSTVRTGSAKTIAAELSEATISRFFGHIHRHEIATKTLSDTGKKIWVGSPGCACLPGRVPGSKANSNWQTGAFWLTLDPIHGAIQAVEHITKVDDGESAGAFFRGQKFLHNYWVDFLGSLHQTESTGFVFSPRH